MNKFAKYVPEEDKKKQREFIGIDLDNMGGSSDILFNNTKEQVLFDGVNIELDTEGTWMGKPNGIPRMDKTYTVIWNRTEYDCGYPKFVEGEYGRPQWFLVGPEECPFMIIFMFINDDNYQTAYKPIITAMAPDNGTYSFKIVSTGKSSEFVYENCVEYQYNYYNDEFRGINGTDNVTHFCVDRMIGGWVYVPFDVMPKSEELVGAMLLYDASDISTEYKRGYIEITQNMFFDAPDWNFMPGLKYMIMDVDNGRPAICVCDGEESWFGPGLYINQNYNGIMWGKQIQVKTIVPKCLPRNSQNFIVTYNADNGECMANMTYAEAYSALLEGALATLIVVEDDSSVTKITRTVHIELWSNRITITIRDEMLGDYDFIFRSDGTIGLSEES